MERRFFSPPLAEKKVKMASGKWQMPRLRRKLKIENEKLKMSPASGRGGESPDFEYTCGARGAELCGNLPFATFNLPFSKVLCFEDAGVGAAEIVALEAEACLPGLFIALRGEAAYPAKFTAHPLTCDG